MVALAKRPVDAMALLKAASKGSAKDKSSPFDYDGDLDAEAGKILKLTRQRDELERELDLAKDQARAIVDSWYQQRVREHGHESSVKVPSSAGVLRITFQHRYGKLSDGKECELRAVVNGKYETYFKPGASLKVRKEISDDPEKLTEVVQSLAQALGAERFTEIFEAEQNIIPTKAFTERRYLELSDEQNAQLGVLGIKQVVAFAQGK